jgi:hypothetical protein
MIAEQPALCGILEHCGDAVVLGRGRHPGRRRSARAEPAGRGVRDRRPAAAPRRRTGARCCCRRSPHAGLGPRRLDSGDIPDTSKVTVTAQAVAAKRNDTALEQIVGRLSLEPNVSAATWQIDRSIPEA